MHSFGDIRVAYGESDEYSFVFSKTCSLYGVLSRAVGAPTLASVFQDARNVHAERKPTMRSDPPLHL